MYKTIRESFENKYTKSSNGCWLWTAKIHKKTRYGCMRFRYQHYLAHRAAYEIFKGPIPQNKVIDHICNVRHCVNPAHLQAISQRENVLKGRGVCAINHRKTHCKNGHSLSGSNLYITPRGARQCRKCRNEAVKRFYQHYTTPPAAGFVPIVPGALV